MPRVLLRGPRLALDASFRLVVLGAELEEKHEVVETIDDVLFNDARTFGVVPTAFYETGFSPSIGARVIHRDLAGEREGMRLSALFAGEDRQRYSARLHTGHRWRALQLQLSLRYQDYQHRFYGLGNADLVDQLRGMAPRSVFERDVALAARYRSKDFTGALSASHSMTSVLSVTVTLQLRRRELSSGPGEIDEPWVDQAFARSSLVGFGTRATGGYAQLLAAYDDRRISRDVVPKPLPARGWRVAVWLGGHAQLDGPSATYSRVGADAQRYIDLAHGDRVLKLRLRSTWLVGALRSVAFPDLAQLGGARLLRGYPSSRFHDRGSLLASAEYRYPVQENFAGFLFIDAGRVADTLDDLSPSELVSARVGYGAGLYAFSLAGLSLRAQLATSIDGGLFIHLLLDASDAAIETL